MQDPAPEPQAPELFNIARPTKYVDVAGRVLVHNEQIIAEDPNLRANEFLGHAVMTVSRPYADPDSTDKLIWKNEQHETTFPIRVRPAVGKSHAEFLGRLLAAFKAFDTALKAHQERTQEEIKKEVERLEAAAGTLADKFKAAAAEADAPSRIIIPGQAENPGGLIVPASALSERHIERGQE